MLKALVQLINASILRHGSSARVILMHRPITHALNQITRRQFTWKGTILAHELELYKPSSQAVRNYAKGKDKKKEKGKTKVQVNETQLAEIINVESLKKQMEKAIDGLKNDYTRHLSLRSSAGSIEGIPVTLDGKEHTLQELAQIVRKNPKTIVVNMAVFPQAIPAALQAIARSGMNLNPQQEGTTLYIAVPTVTKEHRENLAKNAKTLFTKCRDSIKDTQNKQFKNLKKKEGVSIDTIRNIELQVVALADKYISEAEKIMESKQHELVGKD